MQIDVSQGYVRNKVDLVFLARKNENDRVASPESVSIHVKAIP